MRAGVLQSLQRRLAGWRLTRDLVLLAGGAAVAALAAVLLDAALDLPEVLRVATPWLLGAGVVAALAAIFWRRRQLTGMRVARLFEKSDATLGTRLTNAVQLSEKSSGGDVERFFRSEVAELGRATAARADVWRVVRGGMRKAAWIAGVAGVAWFGVAMLETDLLNAVLPRFLDPHGDHPPFSRLQLAVTPPGAEVRYGGQLEVHAVASGRPADKLWLVAKAGTNVSRAIMFLASDKTFFQTLAGLREATEFFVTDGSARSKKFSIGILFTPEITAAEVTADFPEYTRWPTKTVKLSDEAMTFPEDTRLTLRVVSNRPLKSGELVLTPVLGGQPLTVTLKPAAGSNMVSGSFTLAAAMGFSLNVRDVRGLDGGTPRRGRFNILPDQPPRITVLDPGRDAVATPEISVPVRVQATDDHGVASLIWVRGFNRSIGRPFALPITLKPGPQSVEATGSFDLAKLGVKPGDVINYYFEAADNYPKGPNVTLTRMYQLEIISQEQYEKILRQSAARKALFESYFKLNNWLRRMAARSKETAAKAADPSDAAKQEAGKEAAALAKEMEKYSKDLAKLLASPEMFDVEKAFHESLAAQQAKLGELQKQLAKAAAGGVLDPKEMKELADALNELAQTEQQEVGEPAEQIASVARVVAKADEFVKLAQAQKTVAELLRRFGDSTNALTRLEQMEVQELKHKQEIIQHALQNYLAQLPELVAQLPPDAEFDPLRNDVTSFINVVKDAMIPNDMAVVVKVLGEQDAMTGHAFAQVAADKMDKLIAKCRASGNKASQCLAKRFAPKISQGMGNTLQQILAAMGASGGQGQGEQDGYSLFNSDTGLYGPAMELSGEQAEGRGEDRSGSGAQRERRVPGDANDPALPPPDAPGHVRLQPDAKFPLRYRELVGEYFRAISDSDSEPEGKP